MKRLFLPQAFLFLLLFFSIEPSFFYAQIKEVSTELKTFNFLVGKWKADFGEFIFYEEWEKENNKLTGCGYRIKEGQRFDGEKLLLINIYDKISYIASVGTQPPILFALIESDSNKYIFENKEHDFPQRIIYELINNDTLQVFVEGNLKGEFTQDTYNMIRVTE